VKFPHPLLEAVCHETYGVMVYQEQVMEAAKVIAGYTLGGADMLRRAMGKKDPVAMAQERGKFVSGAKQLHNIEEAVSDAIFDILNKFAGYGFNKSHSAAYAILSYQTAYLKANYPVQFMAAVLSSELGNAEKVSHFIDEAMAMGIPVLGPDVNESRGMFTPVFRQKIESPAPGAFPPSGSPPAPVDSGPRLSSRTFDPDPAPPDGGSIRFGLAGIKGVGEQAAERILAERSAAGPYRDFHESCCAPIRGRSTSACWKTWWPPEPSIQRRGPRGVCSTRSTRPLSALGELLRKYPALRPDVPAANRPAGPAETCCLNLADSNARRTPGRTRLAREFAELLRHTRKASTVSTTAPGAG